MSFVVVVHMMLGGDLPFMTMLITNVMVRHVDVDVAELRLHRFRAPKTCGLNVAALKMTKGKKT